MDYDRTRQTAGFSVNFQIEVEDTESVLSRAHVRGLTLYINLRDNHYSTGEMTVCQMEFLVLGMRMVTSSASASTFYKSPMSASGTNQLSIPTFSCGVRLTEIPINKIKSRKIIK